MSKKEARLLALACTFIGIVVGFLIAPIKAGTTVSCGNNNTIEKPADRWKKRRLERRPAVREEEPEDPCEF
ncbi:hypothetical protein EQM14_15450 [Caproiciproducens sp. NJN-50]|uniref:hypothetical protein n=1 Tax=Acutalibacteraceae TaxID=3082771 RepID=UPI000FFE334D|nr:MULTISPECIES: hypothetical protein [Acutalibacteraceae]QAT51051.1 hypothetical protein EQM14_15450 [Caproiciproducens sp. NJN-50]